MDCPHCAYAWKPRNASAWRCPRCHRALRPVDRPRLECRVCGYAWQTKVAGGLPKKCPNPVCKSSRWQDGKQSEWKREKGERPRLHCLRCGHTWHQKTDRTPQVCQGCGQRNWQVPALFRQGGFRNIRRVREVIAAAQDVARDSNLYLYPLVARLRQVLRDMEREIPRKIKVVSNG